MAQAIRRAIQRRSEDVYGTVEVEDGVAASDVEGEGVVKLHALVDEIRCDAGVGQELRGSDHETLVGGIDGRDRVGGVDRIELERARIAPDLIGLVSTGETGAERVRNCAVAAVRTAFRGGCRPGAH